MVERNSGARPKRSAKSPFSTVGIAIAFDVLIPMFR
jgi:hypothetical protein